MADDDLDELKETEEFNPEEDDSGLLGEELQRVAQAAENVADAASQAKGEVGCQTIDYILDVTLQIAVEVGRARMTIQDLLQLGQGSVIELEKLAGEPLDIYMNGKRVAKGEAVIVSEKFGVRILDIMPRASRVESLA